METSCKSLVQENQEVVRELISEDDARTVPALSNLHILEMPDSLFLHIFSYLPFSSIGTISQVCRRWHQISYDELLWRSVFLGHYKLPSKTVMPVKAKSWRSEFKRLYYHTPAVLSEERKEHKDEVLHVSFSHDGTKFATCSKDGYFKVWQCTHPVELLFKMDMKSTFSWKFTQFSQFNETDTCLLVSGVYFGRLSTSGEIAVFNLQDGFKMQCRVTNKPYDVFGAWYDNDHLLSGTLYWTGDFNSVSAVWLSKASQEVESEIESVSMVLYRFENVNSSSIRLLHVAEIEQDEEMTDKSVDEFSDANTRSNSLGPEDRVSSDSEPDNRKNFFHNQNKGQPEADKTSILDHLLRKVIAEDEFDIENEDKTDDEDEIAEDDLCEQDSCDRFESARDSLTPADDAVCCLLDSDAGASGGSFQSEVSDQCPAAQSFGPCHAVTGCCPVVCKTQVSKDCPFTTNNMDLLSGMLDNSSRSPGMLDNSSRSPGMLDNSSRSPGMLDNSSRSPGLLDNSSRSPVMLDNSSRSPGHVPDSTLPCTLWNKNSIMYCSDSDSNCSRNCSQVETVPSQGGSDTSVNTPAKSVGQNIGSMLARAASCDLDIWDTDSAMEELMRDTELHATASSSHQGHTERPCHPCSSVPPHQKETPPHCSIPGSKNHSPSDVPCNDNTRPPGVDNNSNNISTLPYQAPINLDLHAKQGCCNHISHSIATQTEGLVSPASSFHSLSHMSHSSSLSRDLGQSTPREKLLIYTWGSETYIPHKIGIKRMRWTDFSKGEVTARRSSMLLPDVMENLHNMAGNRRDKPDVTIEMHGHIVGLSLSPDHKFLYVNCRPWPQNYIISDPQESPPLAQEVEISTIDLTTFKFVGPVLRSHKAYTHSDECFFLNLDVSEHYVASGAEDRQGYLWDRHYGMPLYRFPHRNVVNCVAVNPQDSEQLVTVSDDYTFKVWISRCRAKQLAQVKSGV
ncbi:F-box/WD repeat-containing protein 5-like isoform X2 [Physella acuta]|uniref:F-box/WD repeat-containing protein 5-like isoform X2 n=1 Tax=Physella acuta TaxID=109671 RepID=UPI0027DC6CAF|nr:F-box/WD repeat-containing protein 5-like isoform X2 [Physella acuta]